ncbi:MAG: GMC family oxidoreductase N-terminal domain-containing protein [Pseudomonadota bacterium]
MDDYDIIIVGAGSAGSVLADRLSADGTRRILVLEAGGSDRRLYVKLPIGYGMTFHDPAVNWRFRAEPDAGVAGRQIYWPRGKGMGGSSSINGLVYSRGLPGDYDDWAAAGNPGWDWASVAPVFERIECRVARDGTERGPGPFRVADRSDQYHPAKRHYLAAAEEAGLMPYDPDAPLSSEGVGPYHLTTRRGLRFSAADAFLRPALKRRNVTLLTGARVQRVLFEGRRATGVAFRVGGAARQARAKTVILAAGAVQSPQILQLSGIGPGALLQQHGIDVVHDNAAVGGHLQDHLGIDYLYRATEPTLNQTLGTWMGLVGATWQFVTGRGGPLSLSVNQMGGMVRARPGANRADIQLYFNPLSYTTTYRNKRPLLRPDPWPGFAIGFNSCRPASRGRVDIKSADPEAAPAIHPAYLSDPQDLEEAVAGARLIERLLATSALQRLIDTPNGFNPTGATDEAIVQDFRERGATVFHACGTCRMAPDGVVGADLKVHGIEGLRVIDASVFPNITSANTNGPTLMLAAKAADMMLADVAR